MPQLIRKIQGEVLPYITNSVIYVPDIVGVLQQEDYINLYGFTAYLQDLKQTEITQSLTIPENFGLPNTSNLQMVTIEIDY
jgi:hypothetical protein